MSRPVWRDGRLEDAAQAGQARATSWGVFTTAGCDHGRPLLWDRHRRRLTASLTCLGAPALELPTEAAMAALLAATGHTGPARLRCQALGSEDSLRCQALVGSEDSRHESSDPKAWHLEAAVGDPGPVGPEAPPLSLAVVRRPAAPPLVGHKTLARLPWDLAAADARAAGADDALLVDSGERVLETSVANLWVVRRGRLLTPPAPERCLPGIMRCWLLEHASDAGLDVAEADLCLTDVEAADEIWVTNAVVGVRRVARVGERRWSSWPAFARLSALVLPAPAWPGR